MDIDALLQLTTAMPEPRYQGSWATIVFRPDLGSQQEFIVGAAAVVDGSAPLHVQWIPALSKLSKLYGDAISLSDTADLFNGVERSLRSGGDGLRTADLGSPHVRLVPCGYFAAENVEQELSGLLKRHSLALWPEAKQRDSNMDDEWAYSTMKSLVQRHAALTEVFVPQRHIYAQGRKFELALDNGRSFGDILSGRYAHPATVENHVFKSILQVAGAHKAEGRRSNPALFIILPDASSPMHEFNLRKSTELVERVQENMGIESFCSDHPELLAEQLVDWARAP